LNIYAPETSVYHVCKGIIMDT